MKTPAWIDKKEYPFESHYFESLEGKMHYVDHGNGPVVLLLHGTPVWSFVYRKVIKDLGKNYRCIAPDHLGFGLSDKGPNIKGKAQDHAKRILQLIAYLNIEEFHIVVHDFGGPIGFGAIQQIANKVKSITVLNTWLWATKKDKEAQKIDRFVRSWIGKLLYLRTNFSPSILFKKAFFSKKSLSKPLLHHYTAPFASSNDRHGLYAFAKSLVGESDWYENLKNKSAVYNNIPTTVLWAKHDPYIKIAQLEKWKSILPKASIHLVESGHFMQEEQPALIVSKLQHFYSSLQNQVQKDKDR